MKNLNERLPKVSVLICTYNAEKYIQKTIESVIAQTYGNIEILVLDNASSDKTVDIIEGMQVKNMVFLKNNVNLGAYGGLNYLLSICDGAYIAINDHDDIWHPKKIEKQIIFLEKNLDFIGCGGLSLVLFEKNKIFKKLRNFHWKSFVPHPSLVFRNQEFRYDLKVRYKTDSYFMKKILSKKGKLFLFDDFLYIHRIRFDGKNLSKRRDIKESLLYTLKTGSIFSFLKTICLKILPMDDIYYKFIMCGKKINNIEDYGFDKKNI